MNIILVKAEYQNNLNAVREVKAGKTDNIKDAEIWLNNTNFPAMFYIDGLQNTDYWHKFGYVVNDLYTKEYKKIITEKP